MEGDRELFKKVAEHLWGDPDEVGEDELRWNLPDRRIYLKALRWSDAEIGRRGTIFAMIRRYAGNGLDAEEWLKAQGFVGEKIDENDRARWGGPGEILRHARPKQFTERMKTKYSRDADGHAKPDEAAADTPLPFVNMSSWDSEEPPPREWAVRDRFPVDQVTLFSGEGSAGKSTIELQRAFAHSLARDWLHTMPQQGPAIFIDCEDAEDELHRRGAKIVAHYQTTFSEAVKGGLHLMSLAGKDAVLATAARNGKLEPTRLYAQLLEAAGDIKPKMISIASSANVFGGNENDRPQVQQFIGLLTRIAALAHGGVSLIAHPSLTGISTDSGISGSTQWHNAVRARCYLKGIRPENGQSPDGDLREIIFKKNNYGPISASLVLRWQNGLYLPVSGAGSLDKAAQEIAAQDVFLVLLRRFTRENRNVSEKSGNRYAPALFAREDEARKVCLSSNNLEAAMRSLFKSGRIWNESHGVPSRPHHRLATTADEPVLNF